MNGQGGEIKVPWWVQAVGVIGVTATIALYLVYWVTTTVAAQMTYSEREVSENVRLTAEVLKAVQDSNASNAETNKNLAEGLAVFRHTELNLLMQACLNAAKSDYGISKCKERMGGSEYIP